MNSDIGEGVGADPTDLDARMLAVISSANIACGGHAGDPASMYRVCAGAVENDVAVGAHVSYVDRSGFGRNSHNVSARILREQLLDQIGELEAAAARAGTAVSYVKPHGALYHRVSAGDTEETGALFAAMHQFFVDTGRSLWLLGFAGSEVIDRARAAGLPCAQEAFADRRYTSAGALVDRAEPDAVMTNATEVSEQVGRLVRESTVLATDGTHLRISADSICVHGDTPGAVDLATKVRATIEGTQVGIAPFRQARTGHGGGPGADRDD